MAVGRCRHCGHQPVAFDAPICPVCAGLNPNASAANKGFFLGGGLCFLIGGGVGFAIGNWTMAVVLAGLGAAIGMVLGGAVGAVIGLITGK